MIGGHSLLSEANGANIDIYSNNLQWLQEISIYKENMNQFSRGIYTNEIFFFIKIKRTYRLIEVNTQELHF